MRHKLSIGIDLMGSDHAPSVLLEAVRSLSLPEGVSVTAIGTPECAAQASFLHFVPAQEFIGMDENPLHAVRRKKKASLCVGMRLLKEGHIDAFVSAGNTGALITAAKTIVGMYPGFLRPALLALMPTKKKPVCILDLGANVEAKKMHLIQFAYLGAAYQKTHGIETPTVGILNIGSEAVKGTAELRAAYKKLEKLPSAPFRFAGNIEGKTVFDGEVDVLITDGFTGNVFLKTAEGLANLIFDRLSHCIPPDLLKKLEPQLIDLQRYLHYAEYSGALLAGIREIVIKCHGYSTPQAFANGVKGALELIQNNFKKAFETELRGCL